MRALIERLLWRWGSGLEVCFAEQTLALRAVLEPTTSVSWQNMRRQVADLGQLPTGQFLYVGTADISSAQYLRRRGKVFLPRRCEEISLGGEVLCYWGLCVPAGEEAAWTRSLTPC